MKFEIRKSYYGSAILEVEANSEKEALAIAENIHIDLDENLGEITCELENTINDLGHVFEIGDWVEVDDPIDDDMHSHSFTGTIVGFNNNYATVEDGEGDCFDVDFKSLTII